MIGSFCAPVPEAEITLFFKKFTLYIYDYVN